MVMKMKRRDDEKKLLLFSENFGVNSNQLDLLLLQFEIQKYQQRQKLKNKK